MQIAVGVEVRDAQTGQSLEGVRVTFFNRTDVRLMSLAAEVRGLGRPSGVSVETNPNGKAVCQCRVRAAFWFRGSADNIVKEEWWPSGRIYFEKTGYERLENELADFFPSPPYTGRKAPTPVVVELKRKG